MPLHTSNSNLNLKLNLNPNGFVTCNIPNTFESSPIRLIYDSKLILVEIFMHSIRLGPSLILVRLGGHCSTHQKAFVILVNALTDKANVHIKKKS